MLIERFGTITLVCGDCMEYMQNCPDKSFDLAIVDPPYGLGIDGQKEQKSKNPKHSRKYHKRKNWDDATPDEMYFTELERVTKNQIIWGGNYFVEHLHKGTKGWIVWFKGQTGLTMSDCELAYSSFNCVTRVVTINRGELVKQNTFHPTEKPLKLYEWLLSNYAEPGQKIIDTHGGSMSHAIAAHKLGFDLTIIEKDPEYYAQAKARLLEYQKQLTLF